MLDFQQINKIFNQPDTNIITMPQIGIEDMFNNRYAEDETTIPFDKQLQNKIKLQQLRQKYEHAQQMIVYAYDDVDIAKLTPELNDNVDIDKFPFIHFDKNTETVNIDYQNIINFKSVYVNFYKNEGQKLMDMWTHHKYQNEIDHASVACMFYNQDLHNSTMVFVPTNILSQNKYNSHDDVDNFVKDSDNILPEGYPVGNRMNISAIPLQNTELMEKYTHQLIDETKSLLKTIPDDIVDTYILDGNPDKVNIRYENPERQFALGINNPIFDEYRVKYGIFNAYSASIPTIMQNIYVPYVKSVQQHFLLNNSWLAKKLQPALEHLDKRTSIKLMAEFVREFYYREAMRYDDEINLNNEPFTLDNQNEKLTEIQSFEVSDAKATKGDKHKQLTLLNDNSFINQISNLNDSNLYFDTNKPALKQPIDITDIQLPLNDPLMVNYLQNEALQNYLEYQYNHYDSISEFYYHNHFQFAMKNKPTMHDSHKADLMYSIGFSNIKYLNQVIAKYKIFLSQFNASFVANVFICESGNVFLTAIESTNEVNNTQIIFPSSIMQINAKQPMSIRLNNREFKSLTDIEIDWKHNINSLRNINVLSDIQHNKMQIFNQLKPKEFNNTSMDDNRSRINNRIKALKTDTNYQKYLSNL